MRVLIVIASFVFVLLNSATYAQPGDYDGVVSEEKWNVLHLQNRRVKGTKPLSDSAKVKPLADLDFTGPKPGHPFVLGNYSADGSWHLVDDYIQKASGKNAALQLCWADQFELEGIIEQAGFGGFFFLVGWDQGRGYSLSNVNFKTSGSPWFIAEMKNTKSLEDSTIEFDHFNWKGEQPFRLAVEQNELTLRIGRSQVLSTPVKNYKPGLVVIGVHDTQYGPKPIRIKSLRVRSRPALEAGE